MPQILNGNQIRDQILDELGAEVQSLASQGIRPGLAAVLVGGDPASEIYVRNKIKACEKIGLHSETITPPAGITESGLLALVHDLNNRDEIDGILVQLPLPPQVDSAKILLAVAPEKDVDGFHPMNVGKLATGQAALVSCTPAGLIEMLKRSQIEIAGKRAVILGRSNIVGKPAAFLFLAENATVTVCHSKTRGIAQIARQADILVAAMGRAAMVTADWIQPGATILDVGMNRVTDPAEARRIFAGLPEKLASFEEKGSVLVGDVHPADMARLAGAYTPVPGGVGPLTIAMLMSNTVRAARLRRAAS